MLTAVFTIAFVLWLIWHIWRGYKKGLWVAVMDVVGLVVAYGLTFFYARDVAELLKNLGVVGNYRFFLAYAGVFIVASQLIRHVPFLLWPRLRARNGPYWGASIGLLGGTASGLLLIWCAGILVSVLSSTNPSPSQQNASSIAPRTPYIHTAASGFVAATAHVGLALTGSDALKTQVITSAIRRPSATFFNARALIQSEELNRFINDPSVQAMMASNDVGSLVQHVYFKTLMELPAMKKMVVALAGRDSKGRVPTHFVAEQLTFVWRRMQYLKDDVRVQRILNDPEFIAAAQGENPMALMTNTKFQALVAIIMDKHVDVGSMAMFTHATDTSSGANIDKPFSQEVEGLGNETHDVSEGVEPTEPYIPTRVYKWTDQHDKIHYSDWESVPVQQRAGAQRVSP